jgi:hypothetical protein
MVPQGPQWGCLLLLKKQDSLTDIKPYWDVIFICHAAQTQEKSGGKAHHRQQSLLPPGLAVIGAWREKNIAFVSLPDISIDKFQPPSPDVRVLGPSRLPGGVC